MWENTEYSRTSWECRRTDGCIHSKGMTSLGLRYTLTCSTLLQAHIQSETHKCTHNCVQTRSGMSMAARVCRVCSRRRRILSELYIETDGASGCGTGARMSAWPPLIHYREIPIKGIREVCPCWALECDSQPLSGSGRHWGLGGELECLDCNSTLCLAAVWVQVCMHVSFFFPRHNELICFQLHFSPNIHTPLTNSSALVWFCCNACAVTYVWYFALSLLSVVPSSHRAAQQPDWLSPWLHLGIQSGRQYTFGPPVETGDDGRGIGPRSPPCQKLPLGEQAAAGPSVQASWLGKVGRGEGDARGGEEWRGGACGWESGSERLDDKEVFTFFKDNAIRRILHYFSSCVISAFKEHWGKFRPELEYSEAHKTVSGPKIREYLFF